VDVTPSSPATLQFTVPAAAPVLIDIQAAGQGTNTIVMSVSGYSTTRSLTNMVVQFTVASGFNVTTSQLTIDLAQTAAAWFESSASNAFGGQFIVSVPFTLQGTAPSGQSILSSVTAVAATVSNGQGTSNSLQATF